MGIATTEEQLALQRSIAKWAHGLDAPDLVRRCEPRPESWPPGSSPWAAELIAVRSAFADLGVLGIALPEDVGGAGGRVLDLAVALEQAAGLLVPGPVLPSVLAGLLLTRHADPVVAKCLLPRLAEGSTAAAVALEPDGLRARRRPDGGVQVSGRVRAVLGAEPGGLLLLAATLDDGDVWFVLEPGGFGLEPDGFVLEPAGAAPEVEVQPVVALDFSRPSAEVHLDDVLVPADHLLAGCGASEVAALAAVLATAEAAGVSQWCLRTACEYARGREQFGRPIGSFQAVKHLCAEMLCRDEQISAVAWDAARAADGDLDDLLQAGAVAAALGLDAAVENAKTCIQVLGGLGFTWEHDAHLYLRRALAGRQWLGGGQRWRRRVAELALAGGRRRLDLDQDERRPGQDEDEDERQRIRAELTEIAALPSGQHRARLAENGCLVPHWPPPYGQGAGAGRQLLIDEELRRAGLERPDLVVGGWALPTIIRHGSPEQRERFVRATLRGDLTWCQLFSEPEAGSDLASLRTRARPVDGGWCLTGQKVWTSVAERADWAICLARTDPEAPQHRGITYFLVDMTTPGIQVRPLKEITGDARFNEVFLDDVFVPDDAVVGPVNDGWRLARTTLSEERVAIGGRSALGDGVEKLLQHALSSSNEEIDLGRVGALVADGTAVSLIGLRATDRRLRSERGSGKSSPPNEIDAGAGVLKLLGVRHRQDVAEASYELLGPHALALDATTGPAAYELLVTRALSIAGGTTQILLTQAAERLLGLPRHHPAG